MNTKEQLKGDAINREGDNKAPKIEDDVREAVEAVQFCINTFMNCRMTDDEIAIWSVGTSAKPRITLKVLKSLISAATKGEKHDV